MARMGGCCACLRHCAMLGTNRLHHCQRHWAKLRHHHHFEAVHVGSPARLSESLLQVARVHRATQLRDLARGLSVSAHLLKKLWLQGFVCRDLGAQGNPDPLVCQRHRGVALVVAAACCFALRCCVFLACCLHALEVWVAQGGYPARAPRAKVHSRSCGCVLPFPPLVQSLRSLHHQLPHHRVFRPHCSALGTPRCLCRTRKLFLQILHLANGPDECARV
eukprot:6491156-Amphidinium_carterae.1